MTEENFRSRYFISYSGVKLPLNLVGEIPEQDMHNRNTYFQGAFDERARLRICRKFVYGEIELEHRYSYHENGALKQALIYEQDGDCETLDYDAGGQPSRSVRT